MRFENRLDAGRQLARALARYQGRTDVVVLGLPRGGVPVARQVAEFLRVPLDVLVVRKVGVPWAPELAAGAVGPGVLVLNQFEDGPGRAELEPVIRREQAELARREQVYRRGRPAPELKGQCAIVVDDGLATGATMMAAVQVLRKLGVERVVVAVPVAPRSTLRRLEQLADEVVAVASPEPFLAVGANYYDFSQLDDDQVIQALEAQHLPGRRGERPGG